MILAECNFRPIPERGLRMHIFEVLGSGWRIILLFGSMGSGEFCAGGGLPSQTLNPVTAVPRDAVSGLCGQATVIWLRSWLDRPLRCHLSSVHDNVRRSQPSRSLVHILHHAQRQHPETFGWDFELSSGADHPALQDGAGEIAVEQCRYNVRDQGRYRHSYGCIYIDLLSVLRTSLLAPPGGATERLQLNKISELTTTSHTFTVRRRY